MDTVCDKRVSYSISCPSQIGQSSSSVFEETYSISREDSTPSRGDRIFAGKASSPGNAFVCIHGRLAPTFNLPVPVHSTLGSVTVDSFEPGICPEWGQIRANSQSNVLFPGCSIRSGEGYDRTFSGQDSESANNNTEDVGISFTICLGSSFFTRTDETCGPSPTLWPGSQAFTTMVCERPVVSGNPVLGLPYFTGSLVQTSSRAMAEQVFSSCYGSAGSSTTRLLSVHGCESGGLGRPSGRSLSFRPVVCSMEQRTHQCSGTPSSLVSSEVLSSGNFRLPGVAVDRQHNRGSLSEQRRGARSRTLSFMATKLLAWCVKRQVSLTAKFFPGKLNVLADSLSRKGQIIHTEWTLHRGTLSQIFHFWEVPHIDLFATRLNNQLPTFVSPFHNPLAWAVDAMSLSWEGMLAYAFLPIPLLLKVLLKMEKETCLVILIAPCWESHPCFPVLLSLLVAPAIKLPWRRDLLIQPHSHLTHPKLEIFNLHAWLCCREVSRRQGFLKNLLREYVPLKELSHSLSTITVGTLGWTGVSNGRWIPSIHL